MALLIGATEGAEKVAVLRMRGARMEAAVLERLTEGRPIHGDVVRLSPRDHPLLYDVETVYEAPRAQGSGPAQVATGSYRRGWDRLFEPRHTGGAN